MDDAAIEAFNNILEHIEVEEYDRCTSAASYFVREYTDPSKKSTFQPDAACYKPYAEFFKLFSDGYHTWQGSYHYTPIQDSFRMASKRLQTLPAEIRSAENHALVVEGLETLCKMLIEYTWCENSTINNDPFALEEHSAAAIVLEKAGIDCLIGFPDKQPPYLVRIVAWLVNYFQKNLYLHTGLNACAQIYTSIMRDRTCEETLFLHQMQRAEEALESLTPQSSELSSELNAHIRHVHQHYERLAKPSGPPTFLRVRTGKLVLSLTAACDRNGAQRILRPNRGKYFERKVKEQLAKLGLKVKDDIFRYTQLMDIFETSFGETLLKSLTFDIEPETVELTFLDKRAFKFNSTVTLSALGTCTLAFELTIDESEFKDGLSVEEIRVLESSICPHAGQAKLEIKRTGKPFASPRRFFDRVNIARLTKSIVALEVMVETESDATLRDKIKKKIAAVRVELTNHHQYALDEAHGMTTADLESRCEKFCVVLNDVIDCVRDETHLELLLSCCHDHTRLSQLAEEILSAIKPAFLAANHQKKSSMLESKPDAELWQLRPDLGWYVYLYAKRIDEVTTKLKPVRTAVAFNVIQNHPDTLGLVIDQREARASFDDWRFMRRSVRQEDNLAHVRSHDADAFYTSEFQTFFYFPDDPQYLVDQYEETVKLNLRLNVGLRFYNWMAEELTSQIREHERASDQDEQWNQTHDIEPTGIKRVFKALRNLVPWMVASVKRFLDWLRRLYRDDKMLDLKWDLERVRRLRVEANELRNLVFKAGNSRYHDHGQLMKQILDQTNVEAAAVITDRHLGQLEELGKEIIERLKASRFKRLNAVGIAISCLLGASATKDFFDAGALRHENPWTFVFMIAVLLVSLVIFLVLGKTSDK